MLQAVAMVLALEAAALGRGVNARLLAARPLAFRAGVA